MSQSERTPRYRNYHTQESLIEKLQLQAAPQAIFGPDSGIARRERPNNDNSDTSSKTFRWMPPAYRDEYASKGHTGYPIAFTERGEAINGCAGGKARCLAAFYLSEVFPDAIVVPMSKFEIPETDPNKKTINPPTEHYKVNGDYLRRLGVSSDRIAFGTESTTIFEGLIEMLKMCEERGIKDAVFVTNEYNKPRAEAMLTALLDKESGIKGILKYLVATLRDQFKDILGARATASDGEPIISLDDETFDRLTNGRTITIVTAEDVLTQFSSLYKKVIDQAKQGTAYQNRAANDVSGAIQIEAGTYGKAGWSKAQGE